MGASLWTPVTEIGARLSNGRFPLDSSHRNRSAPVRWALPFGHQSLKSERACPMGASFRTPVTEIGARLSDGRFPLDTSH